MIVEPQAGVFGLRKDLMARRTVEGDLKTFRSAVLGCLVLLIPSLTILGFELGSAVLRTGLSNVLTVAAALIASTSCIVAATRNRGRLRLSWALMAGAPAAWAVAEIMTRWTPVDLSTPVFGAFAVASVCAFASVPTARPARARAWLDAGTIGLVVAFAGWSAGDGSLVNGYSSLGLVPGLVDVLLLTAGLSLVLVFRPARRLSPLGASLIAGSITLLVLADLSFAGQPPSEVLDSPSTWKLLWPAAFALLALAATSRRTSQSRPPALRRMAFGQVLPSLSAAVILTASLSDVTNTGRLDTVSQWLASCLVVAVLVRQVVTVLEERRLTALLELKVADNSAQFNRRERQFKALVQHSSDLTIILRLDGIIDYVSPSVHSILGFKVEQLEHSPITDVIPSGDQARVLALLAMAGRRLDSSMTAEWKVQRFDGEVREVEVLVRNLISEPAVNGIVLNLRDVTDRKALEDQLTHQALHDELTGLPNRALLRLRIEQALARWLFQNEPFALLVLDIKDFKSINDSLGHVAGDAVLKTFAERISGELRRGDTLVRLGGDEFAVLLERLPGDDSSSGALCEKLLTAVQQPMRIEGRLLALRAHLGLAGVTEQISQADDIMRHADLALHSAKTHNASAFVRFESSMHDSALLRVELEADLRRALENDELLLHYQPTVDLATGLMEGVEALLRWPHPEKGYISPADFIPLAEESGLIVPIGTWVLEQACHEVQKWQARYPSATPLTLHVNLSGRQLDDPDVVPTVIRVLEQSALAPGTLVLEMTESVLMGNKASTLQKMNELVAAGVELAIDDFGTGYSSLSYLRRYPIKVLKIDRSFVNGVGLEGSHNEAALVQVIIDLARTLGLRTVAEGIETLDQLSSLRAMGCDVGQGYFLSYPAPAEMVRRLLANSYAEGRPLPTAVT